jgi:hypothetical protein
MWDDSRVVDESRITIKANITIPNNFSVSLFLLPFSSLTLYIHGARTAECHIVALLRAVLPLLAPKHVAGG